MLEILKKQQEDTHRLVENVSKAQEEYRYAVGKWSLKEALGHIADTERVMSYRLLVVARGDQMPLPSFDEDAYIANADFHRLELHHVLAELSAVRQCTCSLLTCLPDHAWKRTGTVLEYPTTVRAIAYIIAGHALHHQNIIQERYILK
ncbi:DinB family protein [Ectobacillus sp. JY-23]|uniref:DinB family protein n=1 Tax=Ectobacillus sp. JY-23 TaxID=2933872 RepID=UPI0034A034E3